MNKISTRFALLMAAAAVVPLLAYGAVSIMSVRDGAQQAVIQGNQDVARRVAEQLEQYVTSYIRILNALAADLQRTELAQWQQTLILNNFVGQFNEFQQLALVNENGQTVASSGVALQDAELPGPDSFPIENARISRFSIDDDSLPSAVAAIALPRNATAGGWLVGVLQLEQLWRTVDGIRVGNTGYALVVTDDDYILAHGHKDMKPLVARREKLSGNPVLAAIRTSPSSNGAAVARQYESGGEQVLGVAAALRTVGWTVIVEQPTREAFAISTRLQTQLFVAITVALFAMLLVGSLWGRRFIEPILVLTRGTRELASGRLDTRVAVETSDELGQLGTAFNTMADKLVELQEDVRKKERHAMFGRIAIGLVHDLSHPIQNVGNGCKLILKMWDDPEYRESFRRTIERELAQIKRVLDDLRNVAKPMPVERFPIDVNKSVGDLVDSMLTTAENAGIAMNCDLVREPLFVEGDLFALNRIYRNLIINAVQATPPRGRVLVRTLKQNGHAVIEVADTGCGIPAERLESIFDDFVTTKRRGLGLGLAISKKVVEQLGGTIAVTSQVGVGSTFTVQFPLTSARPSKIAAV